MRRATTALLLLALGAGACADEVPHAAPQVAASATRFEVGATLRYRFAWDVDSAANTGILPGDMQLEAGMHFEGELALRVLPPTDEGAVLGIAITRLDRHTILLMGQNALPGPEELVGHELFATVAEDGEVIAIHVAPGTPALARRVVPGLLAQIDLRLPVRGDGAQRVPTGSGLAHVDYAWASPTKVARTLRGYARLDAFDGGVAVDADGRLEIALDERGLPTRIDGTEVLSTAGRTGTEDGPFRSHSAFALERIGSERGPVPVLRVDQLTRIDPDAPPDTEEFERVLAQRFAEGLDAGDVALAIDAAGAGLLPSSQPLVRATGRLRGWPELAEELGPLFRDTDEPRARSLVVDMLASAGTPEAQAVMCELLGDPTIQSEHRHAQWMQRFAFVVRPTSATARFLLGEHERVRGFADDRPLRAVLYPMGSVAGRIAATDPIAAAAIRARLREELAAAEDPELTIAALAGLGNAGAPEDLEAVLARESSELPDVRVTVAIALRRHDSPRATEALTRLMGDADHFVADAALKALDGRRIDADSLRLAGVALGGAFTPELAGRLTSALLRRRADDPWVVTALVAMRERAADPHERDRIDAALATG